MIKILVVGLAFHSYLGSIAACAAEHDILLVESPENTEKYPKGSLEAMSQDMLDDYQKTFPILNAYVDAEWDSSLREDYDEDQVCDGLLVVLQQYIRKPFYRPWYDPGSSSHVKTCIMKAQPLIS